MLVQKYLYNQTQATIFKEINNALVIKQIGMDTTFRKLIQKYIYDLSFGTCIDLVNNHHDFYLCFL